MPAACADKPLNRHGPVRLGVAISIYLGLSVFCAGRNLAVATQCKIAGCPRPIRQEVSIQQGHISALRYCEEHQRQRHASTPRPQLTPNLQWKDNPTRVPPQHGPTSEQDGESLWKDPKTPQESTRLTTKHSRSISLFEWSDPHPNMAPCWGRGFEVLALGWGRVQS